MTAAPAQGFTVALQPTSLSVVAGSSTSSALTITRSGGFAGAVTLAVSGAPAGMTATVTPSPTTGNTATVNITTTAATAAQAYSLTVTGTATGIANQSVTLSTTVTAPSGGAGNATLDYSARPTDFVIIWFGYQDGTGPWTQVIRRVASIVSTSVGDRRVCHHDVGRQHEDDFSVLLYARRV